MSKTKICNKCSREFTPSSRHLTCPMCRKSNSANYKPCPSCGVKIQVKSKNCLPCTNRLNPIIKPISLKKKSITKNGYVRFSNGVFEHRYIVEQKIGRKLLRNENIHHINGVKTDNRIENLELWVSSQPSGQRPDDLVRWAKEILALYDNSSFKKT